MTHPWISRQRRPAFWGWAELRANGAARIPAERDKYRMNHVPGEDLRGLVDGFYVSVILDEYEVNGLGCTPAQLPW